MKNLKIHKGNTSTKNGFNFDYTVYSTLKDDWYNFSKRERYNREYVCDVTKQKTNSLNELKKIVGQ